MQSDSNNNDGLNNLNNLAHDLGIDLSQSSLPDSAISPTIDWMQSNGLESSSQNFGDGNGLGLSDFSQPNSEHLNSTSIENLNAPSHSASWCHSEHQTHTESIMADPNYHSQSYSSHESLDGFGDAATSSLNSSVSQNSIFQNHLTSHHNSSAFYSQNSSHSPYTTINNHGSIYKHTSDSSSDSNYVGYISHRSIYNSSSHYLGYAGTDGNVYDNHKKCVGWVNGNHVYNKAGVEVYETTKGVVGAAAYLLCVYYGGVD